MEGQKKGVVGCNHYGGDLLGTGGNVGNPQGEKISRNLSFEEKQSSYPDNINYGGIDCLEPLWLQI